MTLEAVAEAEAGGVWEQMLHTAQERLVQAIVDGEARRRAGLFTFEDVSAWRLRVQNDGTIYAEHECGHRYAPPAAGADDALAVVVLAAVNHMCAEPA